MDLWRRYTEAKRVAVPGRRASLIIHPFHACIGASFLLLTQIAKHPVFYVWAQDVKDLGQNAPDLGL